MYRRSAIHLQCFKRPRLVLAEASDNQLAVGVFSEDVGCSGILAMEKFCPLSLRLRITLRFWKAMNAQPSICQRYPTEESCGQHIAETRTPLGRERKSLHLMANAALSGRGPIQHQETRKSLPAVRLNA